MAQNMKFDFGSGSSKNRYTHTAEVTGTSEPLLVANTGDYAVVAVFPGTSAKVEYTISAVDKVNSGTANWVPWPSGEVTEATSDSVSTKVTALRLVSVGASTWEVVA